MHTRLRGHTSKQETWDSRLHASLDTVSPSNLDDEKLIITRLPSSLNRLTNHVAISLLLFDSHSHNFFFFLAIPTVHVGS